MQTGKFFGRRRRRSEILQFVAGGSITAKNTIITGFATGLNWQVAGTSSGFKLHFREQRRTMPAQTDGENEINIDQILSTRRRSTYEMRVVSGQTARGVHPENRRRPGGPRHGSNPPSYGGLRMSDDPPAISPDAGREKPTGIWRRLSEHSKCGCRGPFAE